MPELSFKIEQATVLPFAASPTIAFQLHVANAVDGQAIHTIALNCQIQIEVTRRRYTPDEQQQMLDLFGEPDRWSQTLHNLLWTNVSVIVPGFKGSTHTDLRVPCTFDFNVAATKYFYGPCERRSAAHRTIQRNCLLCGLRRVSPGSAYLLGPGDKVPAAGAGVAGHDGCLLPQRCMAPRTARYIRQALPV